ncbi:MAG: hypothetical protein HYZ14_12235 [Bacteroidetes bacterium]|nr:hypothetical protein [Bacteroidota bacterium]
MKTAAVIFLTLFGLQPLSGYTLSIDNGISAFKIDAKISALQKYLVKTAYKDLWNYSGTDFKADYGITSGWLIDLPAAGLTKAFGAPPLRAEVYFDGETDAAGNVSNEDVFQFTFYYDKKESKSISNDLINGLFNIYGDGEMMVHPETGDVITITWFSETTLLTFSLGIDFETGEELDYLTIDFSQAYGG